MARQDGDGNFAADWSDARICHTSGRDLMYVCIYESVSALSFMPASSDITILCA